VLTKQNKRMSVKIANTVVPVLVAEEVINCNEAMSCGFVLGGAGVAEYDVVL
jgi:hypothetical protein